MAALAIGAYLWIETLPSVSWPGAIIAAGSLALVKPTRWVAVGLLVAVPMVLGCLRDPYFASRQSALTACGLWLSASTTGAFLGRLTSGVVKILVPRLRQATEPSSTRGLILGLAVATAIGIAATVGWNSTSSIWFQAASALVALVLAFLFSRHWLELGGLSIAGVLLSGVFSKSNMLPFVVLSAVLWAAPVLGAALAGRLAGGFWRRRGRS